MRLGLLNKIGYNVISSSSRLPGEAKESLQTIYFLPHFFPIFDKDQLARPIETA